MEFLVDKKRLETIALILNNYVEKKDNLSANSNIEITANEILKLRASDGEIGLEYKIKECDIKENGTVLINAKKLIDILKNLNNSEIKIKKLEKSIQISQDKTKFNLPMLQENDFTFIQNEDENVEILISSTELNTGFKMVTNAIDNNGISLHFNCCYIDVMNDKIAFVGSDSKRINVYTINSSNNVESRIVITKRSALELMKILNEDVKVYKNNSYFIVENDNFKFFTKTVSIDFLRYKEVMPHNNPEHIVKINNSAFLNEIKKINAVCQKCQIVFDYKKIIFKNNILDSEDFEETNAMSELEFNDNIVDGKFEINLTNRHMIDFLNLNEQETFDFKFYASNSPVVFESANFLALISANKN